MLREVDLELRALFLARMTSLGAPPLNTDLIGIGPPDDEWQASLADVIPSLSLNIFLADLRENRSLRSGERERRLQGGVVFSEPPPVRVDCHYLITAWSPSKDRKTRTLDEHAALAEALAVLIDAQVVEVDGTELPMEILPPEGFTKLPEFWGTMGGKHRWRPAILLVVTVPVRGRTEPAGVPVTTRFTDYGRSGQTDGTERWLQIGGVVRNNASEPVARAWVQLEDGAATELQATRTDQDGRFDFLRVEPGSYVLRARADAQAELLLPVNVPSATGSYDLAFS